MYAVAASTSQTIASCTRNWFAFANACCPASLQFAESRTARVARVRGIYFGIYFSLSLKFELSPLRLPLSAGTWAVLQRIDGHFSNTMFSGHGLLIPNKLFRQDALESRTLAFSNSDSFVKLSASHLLNVLHSWWKDCQRGLITTIAREQRIKWGEVGISVFSVSEQELRRRRGFSGKIVWQIQYWLLDKDQDKK